MSMGSSADAGIRFARGKYELGELVGRGGMAEVFRGKVVGPSGFEKVVAIKRVRADTSDGTDIQDMLIHEAKISVQLSHRNIVHVYDFLCEMDSYFIVMEFVDGMDLAELGRRTRQAGVSMAPELAAFVASEVACALAYAHGRADEFGRPLDIVHRDVSPQNVLLSWDGHVKLADFGIAKAHEGLHAQTQFGIVKGKLMYMAPEQAAAGVMDERTDVFALGIVLYELLAGTSPFHAATIREKASRALRGATVPIEEVAPSIPSPLAQIVRRALEPDPDARYPTADAMHRDLDAWLFSCPTPTGARDLAALMRSVREPRPDRTSNPARVASAVTPVARLSSGGSAAQVGPGASPERASKAEVPALPRSTTFDFARRSRIGAVVLASSIVAVSVGLVAFGPRDPRDSFSRVMLAGPSSAVVASLPPALALPLPSDPSRASSARIRITSSPAGAEVWSGDVFVGRAPVDVVRPRGSGRLELELRMRGHASRELVVSEMTVADVVIVDLAPMPPERGDGRARPRGAPRPAAGVVPRDRVAQDLDHESLTLNPWE